jgi:hypothetical protein
LESNFRENKNTQEEIINELEQSGNIIISNYSGESNDFINYCHYIEIITFRRYLIRLLRTVINKPEMTWGEVFTQYPKIEEIYNGISEIVNDNNNIQSQYLNSIYQYWEEDIINRN